MTMEMTLMMTMTMTMITSVGLSAYLLSSGSSPNPFLSTIVMMIKIMMVRKVMMMIAMLMMMMILMTSSPQTTAHLTPLSSPTIQTVRPTTTGNTSTKLVL